MGKSRWLHLNLSGPEAVKLLRENGEEGTFLVRPSGSRPGQYTLSVRTKTDVLHIHIQNTGDCYTLDSGDGYGTLGELIDYFMTSDAETRVQEKGQKIELRNPLPCAEPTSERWFHGYVTGVDAEALLKKRGKVGSYLVRESRSKPGSYVLCIKLDDDKVTNIIIRKTVRDGKDCYDFGRDPRFESLKSLIDYYKQSPIILKDDQGNVCNLKEPLHSTKFELSQLNKRIEELSKNMRKDQSGFMEEYQQLQVESDSLCVFVLVIQSIIAFDYRFYRFIDYY